MKDTRVWFLVIGVMLGGALISFYKQQNFVSIPKENTRRNIASESTGQQLIIDDLTNRILSIRNREDLEVTRQKIMEIANKYQSDHFVGVQLFGEVAKVLPEFEGIIWRLRGIVEDTDITHSLILSNLRMMYVSRYAFGPHLEVLFDYLTKPPRRGGEFSKISDFQLYLTKNVKPHLRSALSSAIASLNLPATNHQFYFDRRLFWGHDEEAGMRFFDEKEARKEYIKPHTSYIISGLARTIGTIDYFSVYNYDDLQKIMKKVLKKSAINAFFGRFKIKGRELPQVVSRIEIFKIVRKYEAFATPRITDKKLAQEILDISYDLFGLAAEHDLKGYICSINYSKMLMNGEDLPTKYECDGSRMNSESYVEEEDFIVGGSNFLVDPNRLLLNHRQKYHELRDRYRIYHPEDKSGYVPILSDATGETVVINVKGMFTLHDDLKYFLPIYDKDDIGKKGFYNDKKQWIWNFDYGRPVKWASKPGKLPAVKFGGLLPEATHENIYNIMRSMRLTGSLRPFSNLFTTIP